MMRVLLVCDWFLKYTAGLAGGLVDAGVDVVLLCRDHAREFGDQPDERRGLVEALAARGVDIVVVPGRTSSPGGLAALPSLRRYLRRRRPALVHAQFNYEPRLLALSLGLPSVVTVHDPVPHPGQPQLRSPQQVVAETWLRRAERLVVHGQALRDALPSGRADRTVVIPHGLEPAATPLPAPPSATVLLLGRLEPYKGVATLVAAMPAVWAQRPDVRLIVAGAGPAAIDVPDDPRIERRFGYVPEAELLALLGRASLVVLPYTEASQSGGGSLAVAAGIPVVVSDLGALPDLATDASFVVPPDDAGALASAIGFHIDDGDDVRRRVHEYAVRNLSWGAVARRHLEVYETVL
jgi:glycosyltransferase involved in cell wall biosynthesis